MPASTRQRQGGGNIPERDLKGKGKILLTFVVFISVDRGRESLLLTGFIALFAGEVGVSIVVAQPRPVLVTLATDWEESKYEGGEERMETSA